MWEEISYPFTTLNGATVEVCDLISNFIPHFIRRKITYPCWDLSYTMLVKAVPGWSNYALTILFVADCNTAWYMAPSVCRGL